MLMQNEIKIFKCLLYFLLSFVFSGQVFSQTTINESEVVSPKPKNDAEEKLETIRQTLVSEALKIQARVKASAWLDKSGALHENTRITSDVITSGKTGDVKEKSFVVNDIKPTSKKLTCNINDPRYFRRAQLKIRHGRSSLNLPHHEIDSISKKIGNLLEAGLQTNQNWLISSPLPKAKTSYESLLTSSSFEMADYSIDLLIQTEETFSHRLKKNHVVLNLMLTIEDLMTKKIILSTNYPLPSPWAPPPLPVPRSGLAQIAFAIHEANMVGKFEVPAQKSYSNQFETAVIQGVSSLINETHEAFLCKKIQFSIREMFDNSIQINAGAKRGLKIGDQLLLIDSAVIPKNILEDSAMEKIALIEIAYVSANRAKAIKIAGPDLGPVPKNSRSTITATPF